jgi:hypothetical protein
MSERSPEPSPAPETSTRKPLPARAARWLGEHVGGALVATFVSLAVGAGAAWLFTRGESVSEQVDDVRAGLQAEGFEVEYQELELHQGGPSHMFVASRPAEPAVSDEVRIYDEVDGSLELELEYLPEFTFTDTPDQPQGAAFQSREVADIDRDGQSEILGSYETNLAGEEYQRVPVLIVRRGEGGYEATPLLDTASFDAQASEGLSTAGFGPADGPRSTTVWASDFGLDEENLFSPVRATLVTSFRGELAADAEAILPIEARGTGVTPAQTMQVRFWGVQIAGGEPQVTPQCVREPEGDDVAQPVAVPAALEQTDALLGRELARAMTNAGIGLGDFVDGSCLDPPA